jgi:hypothetical protein
MLGQPRSLNATNWAVKQTLRESDRTNEADGAAVASFLPLPNPSIFHNFARLGPTKEAHRRALNQPDGLLRSVAGRRACGAVINPKE